MGFVTQEWAMWRLEARMGPSGPELTSCSHWSPSKARLRCFRSAWIPGQFERSQQQATSVRVCGGQRGDSSSPVVVLQRLLNLHCFTTERSRARTSRRPLRHFDQTSAGGCHTTWNRVRRRSHHSGLDHSTHGADLTGPARHPVIVRYMVAHTQCTATHFSTRCCCWLQRGTPCVRHIRADSRLGQAFSPAREGTGAKPTCYRRHWLAEACPLHGLMNTARASRWSYGATYHTGSVASMIDSWPP
jgi:hypothetical protein